jgi:hypothetical protein
MVIRSVSAALILTIGVSVAGVVSATNELEFRSLDRYGFSGVTEATHVVVRTPAEWTALWERHKNRPERIGMLPTVDFRANMVVGRVWRRLWWLRIDCHYKGATGECSDGG